MQPDVIILGLGAAGSSALFHLARRGASVLGIERFGIAHSRGSSHGLTRMIRMCYSEHPDYVPLLRRSYELWRELESESARSLLHITGGLYLGRVTDEAVSGALTAAARHSLPHELLPLADVNRRFPSFRVPDDFVGFFEPSAGYVLPEQAVESCISLARGHGAAIIEHAPVTRWDASRTSVRVTVASGEVHEARTLIIAAGAWASRIVPDLGVPLRVTRQLMAWTSPERPELFEKPGFPVWAVSAPDGSIHYGFPNLKDGEGGPGFKFAHHKAGEAADPDTLRPPSTDESRPLLDFLSRTIPRACGPLLSLRACMYTSTPDQHFLIDTHPAFENVLIASPCSGHGFKFAPVMGEVLADLATTGTTRHPIGFLRADRFGTHYAGSDQ